MHQNQTSIRPVKVRQIQCCLTTVVPKAMACEATAVPTPKAFMVCWLRHATTATCYATDEPKSDADVGFRQETSTVTTCCASHVPKSKAFACCCRPEEAETKKALSNKRQTQITITCV